MVGLLKYLLIDLNEASLFRRKNKFVQERLQSLRHRFNGAVEFLQKTIISHHAKPIKLSQLPWYLLLGAPGAGKTSLLANAKVNFILQRQFPNQSVNQLSPSENCDWWVTRDVSLIDVPGPYLQWTADKQSLMNRTLWQCFLRLTRKCRGKFGIDGVIIVLPLPELMQKDEINQLGQVANGFIHRLKEIQALFPKPLSYYLIITKSDLLPGFKDFFSELGNDELNQAWGINLSTAAQSIKNKEKTSDLFVHHFNALIKKLNQQLVWRLHQERNPMARPRIKDFPLQLEKMKDLLQVFIKRLHTSSLNLTLHGVFLTSATQPVEEQLLHTAAEGIHHSQRALQTYVPPKNVVRSYFIKQFLTQGFVVQSQTVATQSRFQRLKMLGAYAIAISLVAYFTFLLGSDFQAGVKQTYAIQQQITEYQLLLQNNSNPQTHLLHLIALLDELQKQAKAADTHFNPKNLLSFYSRQTQARTYLVYNQALRSLLIPEIKNYYEQQLLRLTNHDIDTHYALLRGYLVLGDQNHFALNTFLHDFNLLLPKTFPKKEQLRLQHHLQNAFMLPWSPLSLDMRLIEYLRDNLNTIPNLQLSYLIMRNFADYDSLVNMPLGVGSVKQSLFRTDRPVEKMPFLYTAGAFKKIMNEQSAAAASQATAGNWILGKNQVGFNKDDISVLTDQLRNAYLTNYVAQWEKSINSIQLKKWNSIHELDAALVELVSNHSPFFIFLQTLREQTYFEPIISASPKLQSLGALWDKSANSPLSQMMNSLQNLRQVVGSIVQATNSRKAAFELVSHRMLAPEAPDAIMQVRLAADRTPEPIKSWLLSIADSTWHLLMRDAARYIDTSWREQVSKMYQEEIAHRYPFSAMNQQEVSLSQFIKFFGNPGAITNFYNQYLISFIDTSTPDWRWKTVDHIQLPFSQETLRQIHQALRIHRVFFPQADNKPNLQFALQAYQFGKKIRSVKVKFDDQELIDQRKGKHRPHIIAWPSPNKFNSIEIQLNVGKDKHLRRDFPGDWALFKLVNQSFESIITRKELLLNLSQTDQPAKYLLFTPGQYNPFLSLNLKHFILPSSLFKMES